MISRKAAYVAGAICLYLGAAFIYAPVVSDHPFAYDEADYMWAGTQGLLANYSGRHGISFVEFVRKGLELSRDPGKRQSFSDYIRSSGDIDFYRHYHGPMYVYWLALLHDAGARGENAFRGGSLAIHFATATLILFGMWAVFPSLPPVAALLACALFTFNRSALSAGTMITQHVLFTFFCVASLLACSLFLRNLESRWFYAAMALLACSFCTVETSALLVLALGVSLIVEHRRVREKWPTLKAFAGLLGRGIGVFILTMLVCWPMGILKLGVAKGFLGLLYIAVYRKTFSPLSPLGLWAGELRESPWEFWLLIAGVAAALILWRGFAQRRELLPWLAFSEAVGRAPFIMVEHRGFIKKLVFPVETLPVNLVVSGLVTEFFGIVLFGLALLLVRGRVPLTVLYLPALVIPQVLLTAGVCWFLAALGVFVRDLAQINGYLLTIWFFITPICYAETSWASLPHEALRILTKNPIFVLVRGYRAILLESKAPDWVSLGWLTAVSILVFLLGHAWFYKLRKSFADII